ncbi:hypothetical protein Ae168Ps1_5737 [Pseudonocardia sp. Ae168_Ps1]|uniref:DUF58 domain-containing protein n=1 Tax=unclassified Pseudonocardia TaxID=2619320 RepID=UPI00095A649A|nr:MULTISPECIES: DUF58 domain-containing protein [unclassified Pseudonocardia]OLL71234.1 hypothetical protein Ae168Ps1_5737 [Pseudonocardia sp. Ae168_Ps1]OLL77213.1 hypothetical protein Ae150APs1_5591c [Pseudonocardia sp. Ae150A_Ps1]OLL88678.1 hypothetical protein Ae263Ps1_5733 [Pseudonocardia sp. Ae263_Ps1]OLL91301.1 hypothetical protein Ae356Ps1_1198c [Pseudonocardia sp. Ae356_Ps1]
MTAPDPRRDGPPARPATGGAGPTDTGRSAAPSAPTAAPRTERRAGLTVRGRCLLAGGLAMVVSAVVLDERDLVRVGAFVVLLPLLALVVALRSRRTLQVERSLEPVRIEAGASGTALLRIAGGALLGSLRIADHVPDAAGPSDRYPPRFTVHRLGRRGARVGYPLRPAVRGAYRIGPLRGRGTDPLGLAEFRHDLLAADRWLVLPRVTPLTGRPPLASTAAGRGAEGGSRPGTGNPDVLIRPYRQGDEMRRVHWRSSARRDELMVRLDDRPDPSGVTLLLDRRDAAHRGHGAASSLEWAVEFTASVAVHLVRRGEAVTLVDESGDPLDDGGPVPTGEEDQVPQRLESLAVLRPSATAALGGTGEPAAGTVTSDGVLAVLGSTGPRDVTALTAAWPRGGHAILLDVDGWGSGTGTGTGRAATAAGALRQAGWQVTVVPAGVTVQRAWADACGEPAAPAGALR